MIVTISTDRCIEIDSTTGQPIGHPFVVSNIIEAYGYVPDNFQPFNRTAYSGSATLGVYQKFNDTYVLNTLTNVWEDSWEIVDMSDEEKAEKQNITRIFWASSPDADNVADWVLDEATCRFVPPMPRPTDTPPEGQRYLWQGSSKSWQIAPLAPPNDGKQYYWNFTTWAWEEVAV